VILVGVESFTAAWQSALNGLPAEQAEAWLDLVEQTGTTPEGLAGVYSKACKDTGKQLYL